MRRAKLNDIQTVSLANVCESSLQFVRQMAHKKQIRLQANIDHSLKTCQSDERRLKQILINLLSNAVKFTPAGGEVGLNVMHEPDREAIQFQVWDTGIGISPEDMETLFKPFAQVDSSLARAHEGTGLGLSLVYRLTEMHGGSVSLESQVGVG
ncbi:MAG: ATP-binding protein [Chloroflexota bacterium]